MGKKKALLWTGLIVGAVVGFFVSPYSVLDGWFFYNPIMALALVGPFVGLGAVAGVFVAIAAMGRPTLDEGPDPDRSAGGPRKPIGLRGVGRH